MAKLHSGLKRLYNAIYARKSSFFLAYTVLFLIVALGVFSVFFISGKTFIWEVDGWEQHYKALIYYSQYLRDFFKGLFVNHVFEVKQWDYSIGEGSDVLGTFNYYVYGDPFAFFSFLVPAQYMYIFYEAMVLLRIYLSGVAFSCFCFYMGHDRRFVMPGTLCYTFCYWAIYNAVRHVFFLNPLIYFPLLLLGVEKILDRKRPYVFVCAVTISAVSNLYFFYMLVVITVIYVAVRLAYRHGKMVKMWFYDVGRILLSSVIGVLMSCIILLPTAYFFISDNRFKTHNKFNFIYTFSYYLKLPGLFTIEGDTFWTCMGFAVPVFFAVLLMFRTKREYRILKTYFIICVVMILIPVFGQILNGMSYMCNRWTFAFAMLCSYILVCMMPRLMRLEKSEIKFLAVSLAVYFTVCMCIKYSRNQKLVCVVIAGAALIAVLSMKNLNENVGQCALVVIVMSTALSNGILKMSSLGDNYISQCVSVETVKSETYGSDVALVLEYEGNESDSGDGSDESEGSENSDFLRYSGSGLSYNSNCINGISSSNMYWTLINSYVSNFRFDMAMRIDTILPHKFTGYDDRTILVELSGASYYVVSKTSAYVPYGYTYVAENDDYLLYRNDYALPLSYTYDCAISSEEWNELSYAEKQEALLSAVVIDSDEADDETGGDIELSSVSDIEYESVELSYRVEYDDDEVQAKDGSFAVTKQGASVTFLFDGLSGAETYFNINGLEYDGVSEFQLYFGDDRYDPLDNYSREGWSALSGSEKYRIFSNFMYSTQSTSSATIDLTSSSGITKSMNYFTEDYSYYNGQKDFLVNMGYSDDSVTAITVTFNKIGLYTYDEINIVCQPMSSYEEKVNALKENVLEDVRLLTNSVTGSISVDKDKILCIAIPYSDGWEAYVDGVKTQLYSANGQYMAISLSAGEHTIELKYHTPLLRAGCIVSALGIVLFLMYIIVWEKTKKPKQGSEPAAAG